MKLWTRAVADSGALHDRGHLHAGLNTGSVIIRNSDWSRMLVEDMATYGKYPVDWAKEAVLRAAVPTYDMGMYEQNVLIYRLTSDPSMMQRVRSLVQSAECAVAQTLITHAHMSSEFCSQLRL